MKDLTPTFLLPDTLASGESVAQAWDGIDLPASTWCADEAPYLKLREFKHSYGARDRVLTLPILKGSEPRSWGRSWEDGDNRDDLDWQRLTTE